MEDKVLILMATYNGKKYIRKQIESLFEQTYYNWDLCISDDGSDDNTMAIIEELSEKDRRILPVLQDNKKHGACLNFYHLLRYAKRHQDEYSYFCLCDQDDIWDSEKILTQVEKIKTVEGDFPKLLYSDLQIISEDEDNLHKMSEIQNIRLINHLDIFFNQIFVWGNTVMFNRVLLDKVVIPDDIGNNISHDHYLAFYAAALGKIIYIDRTLVKYRRYNANVSELPHRYSVTTAVKKLLCGWKNIVDRHAENYNSILYFIYNAPECTQEMTDVRRCYEKGGIEAFKVIKKYHISVGANKYNRIAKKIILYSKVYKKSNYFCSGKSRLDAR